MQHPKRECCKGFDLFYIPNSRMDHSESKASRAKDTAARGLAAAWPLALPIRHYTHSFNNLMTLT